MTDNTTNRESKDALFKIVFGEHPENALALYNAINKTHYTNAEDIKIRMLRDALYVGIKNDVAFMFNYELNLYEAQSTYCPNMPLRGLEYFLELYKMILGGEETAREKLYGRRLVRIPTPKFYVFYNGSENRPESEDLYLSTAYESDGDIEVTAHMININEGFNEELLRNCKPLADYSELFHRLRVNLKITDDKNLATARTVDSCIKDGILEDILREERARMIDHIIGGLTEEEKERLHAWESECAREEGLEKGLAEGLAKGLAKGHAEGLAEGQESIIKMNEYLLRQERFEDLMRATGDKEYREKILAEMEGLSKKSENRCITGR